MRGYRFASILGFADQFDIAAVGDEHGDAVAEQQMIVGNQHADRFTHDCDSLTVGSITSVPPGG